MRVFLHYLIFVKNSIILLLRVLYRKCYNFMSLLFWLFADDSLVGMYEALSLAACFLGSTYSASLLLGCAHIEGFLHIPNDHFLAYNHHRSNRGKVQADPHLFIRRARWSNTIRLLDNVPQQHRYLAGVFKYYPFAAFAGYHQKQACRRKLTGDISYQ